MEKIGIEKNWFPKTRQISNWTTQNIDAKKKQNCKQNKKYEKISILVKIELEKAQHNECK